MRGRHCHAILQMLGIGETVAGSADEYVDIAVRLARDPALRAAIRQKTAANKARLFCRSGARARVGPDQLSLLRHRTH